MFKSCKYLQPLGVEVRMYWIFLFFLAVWGLLVLLSCDVGWVPFGFSDIEAGDEPETRKRRKKGSTCWAVLKCSLVEESSK